MPYAGQRPTNPGAQPKKKDTGVGYKPQQRQFAGIQPEMAKPDEAQYSNPFGYGAFTPIKRALWVQQQKPKMSEYDQYIETQKQKSLTAGIMASKPLMNFFNR